MKKSLLNLVTHWNPASVLAKEGAKSKFCLIILNQPIHHVETFNRLWNNATFKFVADGGSNRLYDAFKHDQQVLEQYLPDEIRGDLDSIRPDVREYYESKNVKITKVSDQMTTDFMKCVELLNEKEKDQGQIYDIVATPALGGRFDQTMHSINLLYMLKDQHERKCILVSDENLTVLLDKGDHEIKCQLDLEGPTCGLIPFGEPATLTTNGLKWDMDGLKTYWGGLISTSNVINNEIIKVTTNAPVVWTVEINLE